MPVEHLEKLANQVFEVLKGIIENEKGGIDMDRMKNVIQRYMLKVNWVI